MSKTRKCPICGEKMPDNMRFCGSCGADMDREDGYLTDLPRPIRRPDEPRPEETAIRPEKRRGARRGAWQYILVIAIIAVVIAIAVMLVIRMNEPAEPQTASESFDNTVHVINAEGEEITPTPTAAPEPLDEPAVEEQEPAAGTEAPEPTDTPEPTEAPDAFDVTDTSDTVYVTGSGVNLRTGPGTTYDIAAILNAGTELKRTGTTDNSWSRVTYEGSDCYISNAFISTEKPADSGESTPAPGAGEDTVVVTAEANVRSGPGTGYDILGQAAANTELKRTGTENGWSKVIFNGSEGYIYDGLIRAADGDQLEEKTGKLTVTGEVNLREGPDTTYKILGVAQAGAELNMTGKVGAWYRIEYDGKTAYVNRNYVKEN